MLLRPTMRDAPIRAGAAAPRSRCGRWARSALAALLLAWAGTAYWHAHKPLPPGVHVAGPWREIPVGELRFIADITAADAYGRPVLRQAIFDETLSLIRSAREFLVIDFFLFNDHRGMLDGDALPIRPLSRELREALIARKQAAPGLRILFITDPINEVYGGVPDEDLALLRAAGIDVVVTDLDRLRDSNLLYSGLWRVAFRWWASDRAAGGPLPHPFQADGAGVGLGAWMRLMNFKANHRKLVLGDDGRGRLVGLVASANPHDASSAHSNVAITAAGPALESLLASELAIARFSGWTGQRTWPRLATEAGMRDDRADDGAGRVQVLTEGAIRGALLERIGATANGDSIDIAMFYLAERSIIEALLEASHRGVRVRLILDPNKDAFGRTKSGIPNRPAATELVAASDGDIRVRWYRTHGEQFHTKLVAVYDSDRLWLTAGSANLTRRNLADYNLEANLAIEVPRGSPLALQVLGYFETLWRNRAPRGMEYTADFGVYADPAQSRYWLYRIMEATGLSTF